MMKIKRENITGYFIVGGIVISSLLSQLFNIDFIILFLYCFFITWIVFRKQEFFFKFFYFIFVNSWMLVSVFLIENTNMYLPNLQQTSYWTGAFGPLACIVALSFVFTIEIEKHIKAKVQNNNNNNGVSVYNMKQVHKLGSLVIIVVLAMFLLEISKNNYYSSGSINRFYFLAASTAKSVLYYGYLLFFIPIISINAMKTNRTKLLIIFICGYILFLILVGNKFSPIFQTLYILCICYILPKINYISNRNYRKFIKISITIALVLFLFSLFQMSYEKDSFASGITMLLDRLSNGQGDVWWGIYSAYGDKLHINEIGDELSFLGNNSINQLDYNFGIYKMMKLISTPFILQNYAIQGARFAMSTDASLYYYFGIVGAVLLKTLMMSVIALIVNKIVYTCKSGLGFQAILYVWLLTHFMRIYAQSDFNLLLSKSFILAVAILFVLKKITVKK